MVQKTRKRNGCLLPCVMFFVMLAAIGVAVSKSKPSDTETKQSISDEQTVLIEAGMSEEQADEVGAVFILSHFGHVKRAELCSELEGSDTIYEVETEFETPFMVVFDEGGTLKEVNIGGGDRKIYSDGSVQLVYMSLDERATVCGIVKEMVLEILKAPSTAEFPTLSEWGFRKSLTEVVAQGYVDAQNSFGVQVRSKFQVVINISGDVTSFIFDGEELIS